MIKIERLKDVSIPVMGVLEDSVVDGEGLSSFCIICTRLPTSLQRLS